MTRRLLGALLLGMLCFAGFRAVVPPNSATGELEEPGSKVPPSWSASPADSLTAPAGFTTEDPSARRALCVTRGTLIARVSQDRVAARSRPSRAAPVIERFGRKNGYGAPQVFNVLDTVTGPGGGLWYEALLPIRPNGTTGFIPSTSVRLLTTPYRLKVDRARLRLELWKGCGLAERFPIGIGTGLTPTPVGRFYLVALLKPPTPDSIYGTYAYGLSAFTDSLDDWAGDGVIGLHGTNDPSSIGRRSSHGCIRMRNGDIARLVEMLPLGTPIDIR
jgi:lipoprotein-anchoring transpeptidase ErfK/SrfK